jgi:hypothetical protein
MRDRGLDPTLQSSASSSVLAAPGGFDVGSSWPSGVRGA